MSEARDHDDARADARAELLVHDAALERRTLWKGLVSLVGVLALAFARQRWWL